MYAEIEVKYEYSALPLSTLAPKVFWYSEYEVTTVGIPTGPFTVGPTIAAPACTGWAVRKDWSFSLANTPGDKLLLPFYNMFVLFINMTRVLKNAIMT